MIFSSHNKVAIITGGADGIGEAIARLLAKNKFKVAIVDLDHDKAVSTSSKIEKENESEVIAVEADISDHFSSEMAYKKILKKLGNPTVLINNAGIMAQSLEQIEKQKIKDFERMMSIHVNGTFVWSQMAVATMRPLQFGRIVNLSSILGLVGVPFRLGYSTAKTAIIGFTRSLAVETARFGITVNAIAPGYVLTKILKDRVDSGILNHDIIANRTPVGRWAQPEEVASLAGFLAGEDAGYITGATIPIDGGFHVYGNLGESID